jgi:regulator of protease activity HflC (stomatin/prohibitin superfamily)
MKALVSIFVIMVLGLLVGVIVVDERQNAIVTNQYGKQAVYKTGIYLTWPIVDKVTYVYVKRRHSIVRLDLVSSNHAYPKLQFELLLNWQVDNPQVYLSNLNKLGKPGFNELLSKKISAILVRQLDLNTLGSVNQSEKVLAYPERLNELGIILNTININSVQILSELPESSVVSKIESSVAKNIKQQEVAASTTISDTGVGSAYYHAQAIKGETMSKVAKVNQGLVVQEPKFYEYFSKLNTYQASAKSAADMPPLSDLYK